MFTISFLELNDSFLLPSYSFHYFLKFSVHFFSFFALHIYSNCIFPHLFFLITSHPVASLQKKDWNLDNREYKILKSERERDKEKKKKPSLKGFLNMLSSLSFSWLTVYKREEEYRIKIKIFVAVSIIHAYWHSLVHIGQTYFLN